jgi:hypothetical protein
VAGLSESQSAIEQAALGICEEAQADSPVSNDVFDGSRNHRWLSLSEHDDTLLRAHRRTLRPA